MKIGTLSGYSYSQKRLILDGGVKGVEFLTYRNWGLTFQNKYHSYDVYKPFFQNVDGYHVFNTILLTERPWCCTFETLIPRGRQLLNVHHHNSFDVKKSWYMNFLLKALSKDNCKKLFALSDCNLKLQYQLYSLFPNLEKTLKNKTCKTIVPQQLLSEHGKDKLNEKIKFIFIGIDFVRKGGREIISAFHKLRKKRQDFELIMITNIQNTNNYAFKDFQDTKVEIGNSLSIIENSKDWLNIYPQMPFNEVKELMLSCDVGLLPTWADSYGYSVLEMQSAGVPVISTNIRAIPETNQNGWIINLPLNYSGELGLRNREHKEDIRKLIIKGLYDIFDNILDDKNSIIEHSVSSHAYIKKYHSPIDYTKQITEIYNTF